MSNLAIFVAAVFALFGDIQGTAIALRSAGVVGDAGLTRTGLAAGVAVGPRPVAPRLGWPQPTDNYVRAPVVPGPRPVMALRGRSPPTCTQLGKRSGRRSVVRLAPGRSAMASTWSKVFAKAAYGAWTSAPIHIAVLLEPAASPAREISDRDPIVGASSRRSLGAGDFQLIYTRSGPFVLVREQKTDGKGGLERAPQWCARHRAGAGKVQRSASGNGRTLASLQRIARGSVAPQRAVVARERKGADALFNYGGVKVAEMSCISLSACELRAPGIQMSSSSLGVKTVTVARIRAFGPR